MSRSNRHSLAIGLTSVLVLATGCAPAWAQETDHAAHHPAAKPAASPSSPRPADPHAGHRRHAELRGGIEQHIELTELLEHDEDTMAEA